MKYRSLPFYSSALEAYSGFRDAGTGLRDAGSGLRDAGRVSVFWNSRANLYSVLNSKGRTIAYASELVLRDVSFIVHPAGRARVVATGRKNAHAFIRGRVAPWRHLPFYVCAGNGIIARYNPLDCATFQADGIALSGSSCAWLATINGFKDCIGRPRVIVPMPDAPPVVSRGLAQVIPRGYLGHTLKGFK